MIALLILAFFLSVEIAPESVRYGILSSFKEGDAVAVIDSKQVYSSFREYQIIKREGIEQGTARYNLLMSTCTKRYKALLKKHASGRYVLVVEVGGITDYKTTNITRTLIDSKGL